MRIDESRKNQKKLEDIIYTMALAFLPDEELKKTAKSLKELYTNDFRHSYSHFYPLIVEISRDNNDYNLEKLTENLKQMQAFVETDISDGSEEFKDLYLPLSKLVDHMNLEIARFYYYTASEKKTEDLLKQNKKIEKKTEDLLKQNKKIEKTLEEAQASLDDSKRRAETVQTEYTTILGIFASIILAFTGTITFSSSVLENVHKPSIYRLITVTLILGLISFNILFLLIDFIIKINKKEECTSSNAFKHFKNNIMALIFNAIIIIGILVTCFAYRYKWFERRAMLDVVNPQEGVIVSGSIVADKFD